MDKHVTIHSWMTEELNLSGNELMIFALIYGFSQDGESEFYGSRSYIAKIFNITLPTVDKALRSLIQKNLIIKEQIHRNNIKFNTYKVSLSGIKILYRGDKDSLQNNIINNDNNYHSNNKLLEDINYNNSKELLKPRRKNLFENCCDLIDSFTDNIELNDLLKTYLNMRLEIKDKQLYKNTWKGLLNKLNKLSDDVKVQCEIVQRSIDRGYASFYELPKGNGRKLPWNDGVQSIGYTEEELNEMNQEEMEMKARGRKTRF